MNKQRDIGIDFIKAIAILGVIVIHISFTGTNGPVLSLNWTASVFYGSIFRASVPLFFMCSGALLLSPQRKLTVKRLYSHNILRIVIALLAWAFFYKLAHMFILGEDTTFSVQALIAAVKETVLFRHEYHLYYLHIVIILYALLPVLRVFVKHASPGEIKYALAFWFVLGIVYPTAKHFWPFTLLDGIPAQWLINMTYASVGYALLGYYLKQNPFSRKTGAALAAVGAACTFVPTVLFSVRQGSLCTWFLEGMSVGVSVLAAGLFILLDSIGTAKSECRLFRRIVTTISKASFCIYLVHVFIISLLQRFGILVNSFSCIASIPVFGILILLLSYCAYSVLKRIPVVKTWLV